MGADQEVGQEPTGTVIALFSTAFGIRPKGSAGGAPDGLIQVPIDSDSVFFQERSYKILGSTRTCNELGKYRGGDDEISTMKSRVQSFFCGLAEVGIVVPQGDDHVGIDRCVHWIGCCLLAAHFS